MHLLFSTTTDFQSVPVHDLPAVTSYRTEPAMNTQDTTPGISLCCRDIGLDCSFEVVGETRPAILREFIRHAESSHNMPVLSAMILFRIKESMKQP